MHLHYTLASALFIGTALSFPISRTHAAPQNTFISRSPILKHGQNSRLSVGDVRGGGLADAYNTQLEKRPILTKSFTCLVIASIGDVISQTISPGFTALDFKRLRTFGIAQFVYFGPVMHYWFQLIDDVKKLPYFQKETTPKWQLVLAQVFIDQTVGTVLVLSGFFMSFGYVTQIMDGTLLSTGIGAVFQSGAEKVRNDLWPTLLANWRLWPAANAINFAMVPLQFRVSFSNFVAVIWNIYLAGAVSS